MDELHTGSADRLLGLPMSASGLCLRPTISSSRDPDKWYVFGVIGGRREGGMEGGRMEDKERKETKLRGKCTNTKNKTGLPWWSSG